MAGPRANRVDVILACSVCKARNYKTTKKKGTQEKLELKKFCKKCGQHTLHKETK
jgi:large subunit ribosomal protein L33